MSYTVTEEYMKCRTHTWRQWRPCIPINTAVVPVQGIRWHHGLVSTHHSTEEWGVYWTVIGNRHICFVIVPDTLDVGQCSIRTDVCFRWSGKSHSCRTNRDSPLYVPTDCLETHTCIRFFWTYRCSAGRPHSVHSTLLPASTRHVCPGKDVH